MFAVSGKTLFLASIPGADLKMLATPMGAAGALAARLVAAGLFVAGGLAHQ